MTRIIAIMGAAQSGKTTVGKIVEEYKIGQTIRMSFAAPLKEMLLTMGLSREDLYGADKEKPNALLGGKTPRHAMQTLGTEWRDTVDKRLWSNILEKKLVEMKELGENNATVLIDDCRFEHEVEMLRGVGAEIWLVRRYSVEHPLAHMVMSETRYGRTLIRFFGNKPLHPSETYWPHVENPIEIDNNSSPEKLRSQVIFHLRGEPDH